MEVNLLKGKYVVAVSGGVDSVALLDLLAKKPELELVVAHFNHGIRKNSCADAEFVSSLAKKYGLTLEVGEGGLGKDASEDSARRARYIFLKKTRDKYGAKKIITAHHQDDWIETAFINLIRGSGPQGLVSISQNKEVERPLLNFSKADILAYAHSHRLKWREDSTNQSLDYLRNYLRLKIIPSMSQNQRDDVLNNIEKVAKNQSQKAKELATLSHLLLKNNQINRHLYTQLPPATGRELLALWLKEAGYRSFDRSKLSDADMVIRTGKPNTSYHLAKDIKLNLKSLTAQLTSGLI